MLIVVLIGFFLSALLLFTGNFFKEKKLSTLLTILPLGILIYLLSFGQRIAQGEVIYFNYEWIPAFDVSLNFRLDGLSFLFGLLISGIGALVFFYTSSYLKGHHFLDRFYSYLSMFMAAMLGLVLSDNLITMFIFWELTSITSFFLIGFNNESESCRKSALVALGITGLGGFFLLAGAVLIGESAGTYSISQILSDPEAVRTGSYFSLICIFMTLAAFTKSAQFPFHFWLPGAMQAPTPVSTYLHSATMVKAGVYLLFRFSPVFEGSHLWHELLLIFGAVTMIYSAYHIIFRIDLKSILAYSTIAALGILVFLIGIGTKMAITAAAVFIVVHALYKASLFLIAGIIDHETGTRDITRLSGLRHKMMLIFIIGIVAAAISGGIPPTLGFIGKELIYESTYHFTESALFLTLLAIFTKILLFYAGFVVGVKPFTGKLPAALSEVHKPDIKMSLPPAIMVILGLVFGIFPGLIEEFISGPITRSSGFSDVAHLKLWHGFSEILVFSMITIIIGTIVYLTLKPNYKLKGFISKLEVISPLQLMNDLNHGFEKLSGWWTNLFQNGYLRHYIATCVLFMVISIGYVVVFNFDLDLSDQAFHQLTFHEVAIVVIMLGAVIFTVVTRSRLAAVVAMGIVGFCFSLIFLFYGAPDLAMTQFSVDTLTVILFVLVLYKLPKYLKLTKNVLRLEHGILSLTFGTLISMIILMVLQQPVQKEVSEYYGENAYLLAKGKNVVNVILVDFRGIDTLIEVSVLTVASLGVFGLIKLRIRSRDKK